MGKLPPIGLTGGPHFHIQHPMGRDDVFRARRNLFLAPEVTDVVRSKADYGQRAIQPDRHGCLVQVEDAHGVRAVVQVAAPNLHSVLDDVLMGLMTQDILVHGIHLVVAQEVESEVVDLGDVAADGDHREMCVYCSSGVSRLSRRLLLQPTLPTMSMSGSFQ